MNKENFPTDSFILASYLLSESIPLIGMNTTNPRRVIFLFEESSRRKTLTEKFLSHKALVEPHRYFSAQKDIKQMIYQNN
jgi:hypothetical protein